MMEMLGTAPLLQMNRHNNVNLSIDADSEVLYMWWSPIHSFTYAGISARSHYESTEEQLRYQFQEAKYSKIQLPSYAIMRKLGLCEFISVPMWAMKGCTMTQMRFVELQVIHHWGCKLNTPRVRKYRASAKTELMMACNSESAVKMARRRMPCLCTSPFRSSETNCSRY